MRIQEYEEAVAVEVQLPEVRRAIYYRSMRTYMWEVGECQWPARLLPVKQGRLNISIYIQLHVYLYLHIKLHQSEDLGERERELG
jgi:hypothetical protein